MMEGEMKRTQTKIEAFLIDFSSSGEEPFF